MPNSNNAQSTASKNKKDIQIVVNDKGVIFVDSTKTDTKGIYRVMYDTIKKRGKKKISLTSDIKAPYGVIIRILDAAKRAGDENVGFVTS
uniref:Biopolymer transport protein ExbD/TolR n=1 Tax=mine drainage metagenome TaxID=410659 RepID=E6Q7T1_9ZZZZ